MTKTTGDEESVDPVVTALGKMAGGAGVESAKEAGRLLTRVLGPSADEIGEALARYTTFRLRNVGRITEKANAKTADDSGAGEVPPRVAHRLLEEGSYCDDELMAEYLGGVLAAGRTPKGRDDRAVVWSDLVTSLSTLQLRAHFLLYREWAARLHGRSDVKLATDSGREASELHADLEEFASVLMRDSDITASTGLPHAIPGLVRTGLLHTAYAWGRREDIPHADSPFEYPIVVGIMPAGIELYGWAQGESGMTGWDFTQRAKSFAEEFVPRLTNVALPRLPEPSPPEAAPLT